MSRSRGLLAGFSCAAMLLGASVGASAQTSQPAALNAYNYALRCFAANTVTVSDARYNPNRQNDASLRQAARRAFDAAQVMGGRLGYSRDRIAADITRSGNVEGGQMLRDDAYFQRTRADCIRLGML